MIRKPGFMLVELLVTSVLFSLMIGALMSALSAVPRWARSLADHADLVQELRVSRLAFRRDLAASTALHWLNGELVIETGVAGADIHYGARRNLDGAVIGLERVDPAGHRTLIAAYLVDFRAMEEPQDRFWIQLTFQRGREWRRLVLMTCPR